MGNEYNLKKIIQRVIPSMIPGSFHEHWRRA